MYDCGGDSDLYLEASQCETSEALSPTYFALPSQTVQISVSCEGTGADNGLQKTRSTAMLRSATGSNRMSLQL